LFLLLFSVFCYFYYSLFFAAFLKK